MIVNKGFASGFGFVKVATLVLLIAASCSNPIVKNPPGDHYFLYQNRIEIKGGIQSQSQKNALTSKLMTQLDDSAKVTTSKKLIFLNLLKSPFIFDTTHIQNSAENMVASLFHLGYYHAQVSHKEDTSGKKIKVKYIVEPGTPTIIDSIHYHFTKSTAYLENKFTRSALLKTGNVISKISVLSEINRLVDSFRNNGYFRFSTTNIKVTGDTFPSKGTNPELSRKDTPIIRLNIIIQEDSALNNLNRYPIRHVRLYIDPKEGDFTSDSSLHEIVLADYTIYYHELTYKPEGFENQIAFKKGGLYAEKDYFETIGNLTRTGYWRNSNIQILEAGLNGDSLDININLSSSTKFRFETALEISYSASSNVSNILAGNLFGISGNVSLSNRNLARQGIKMTHNIRGGIELNNRINPGSKLINSNEIGYENTTAFPKLILPSIPNLFNKKSFRNKGETFISAGVAYNTRLNLFNLQSINTSFGWTGLNKKSWRWSWSPVTIGFSNLFNQSDSFKTIVQNNPFLRYSYNTALVAGMNISFSKIQVFSKHKYATSKENSYRFNAEESGITWGALPVFTNYKRRYVKTDAEFKHTVKYKKSALVVRTFLGLGIPLFKTDTVLPFFKQYFGGGSNSMRAWPVRGIGPGGKGLIPYSSNRTIFNDRTGDMQFEFNTEYRFDIGTIIPNTLTLRGAVFTDIGNIWNIRNTNPDGSIDSAQFNIKNFYSQLGVAAGTGIRLDFNYFVIRLDLGFRFKRPELFYIDNGWRIPSLGFDDVLKKIFTKGENDVYRKWRYENFNFTFGIGYSF